MAKNALTHPEELPRDNAARIALFDAVALGDPDRRRGLTEDELFSRVIPRLRRLVPQELHVQGDRDYFTSKVAASLDADLLRRLQGSGALTLGSQDPFVQYPDGSLHRYRPGLEGARERLEGDDTKLRSKGFIVTKYLKTTPLRSQAFSTLVDSMREHGYISALPVIESSTGDVLDGRARLRVAEQLEIPAKKIPRVALEMHRDGPLQQTLLVLDINAARIDAATREKLENAIGEITGRKWEDIRADLDLTRDWRQMKPKRYTAWLDVKIVPFKEGDPAGTGVQVTTDETRLGLRSLMQQVGIAEYNRDHLKPYAPFEEARSSHSRGGKKTHFVRVSDAINGIAAMQADRESRGLKVDHAWDELRRWLIDNLGGSSD